MLFQYECYFSRYRADFISPQLASHCSMCSITFFDAFWCLISNKILHVMLAPI